MKKYILMTWSENRPQINDKANFNFIINDSLEEAKAKQKGCDEWNKKRVGIIKTKPLISKIFEFEI